MSDYDLGRFLDDANAEIGRLEAQLERYERALGVYRSELERMAKQQTILIGNPYGSSLRQTLREGDAALSEPKGEGDG